MTEKPKVKAPQKRATPSSGGGTDRRRILIVAGVAVTALVVAAGAFFLLGSGSDTSTEDARAALTAAGCTLQEVEARAGNHTLGPDETSDRWNTDPPTSGPHFGFNPNGSVGTVIWGVYDEPVQLARAVHNLEHGGIYIFYGDEVSDDVVAELNDFYQRHENGTLVAPLPRLGDQIALGAWVAEGETANGYLAKCPAFDDEAFSAFFSAFQFKGPEAFPAGELMPGTN